MDVVELAAVFFVLSQVTHVSPVISTIFMSVLFRAAIGGLGRLLMSQAGCLGAWALAIALPFHVEPVLGAMISLPTTTLMVYGTRTLMAKLQEQQAAQNALLEGVLVTAQRSYEEHLHKAAYFDMLTGLPNRRMLFERLAVASRGGTPYAMLLIDLNDFKTVNDTLGHKIGDELLAGVAKRIHAAVDGTATVARLGGDEFAVFLPHAGEVEAGAAARAMRDAFAEPVPLSCGAIRAEGTVGVSVAAPGESPDEVLERADAAMYRAKPAGRRRTRGPQSARNVPAV